MSTSFVQQMLDAYELDAHNIPPVYTRFLQNVDSYSGKSAWGFLGTTPEEPMEMDFHNEGLLEIVEMFDDNDIDRNDYPDLVPLARFPNEGNFLLVDLAEESCPVMMWEHETGEFEEVSPSLEAFLSTLQ